MLYPYTLNSFKLLQDTLNRREGPNSASPTVWFTVSPVLIPPSIPSSPDVGVGSQIKSLNPLFLILSLYAP